MREAAALPPEVWQIGGAIAFVLLLMVCEWFSVKDGSDGYG